MTADSGNQPPRAAQKVKGAKRRSPQGLRSPRAFRMPTGSFRSEGYARTGSAGLSACSVEPTTTCKRL